MNDKEGRFIILEIITQNFELFQVIILAFWFRTFVYILVKLTVYVMPREHYTQEKDFKGEIHANNNRIIIIWSHGVMVSTLDFESSDPSSNLGGTS